MLYRITAPDERSRRTGCSRMVDTDQISTSADEPGLVIRNEDVFIEKVRERVALAEATGHLLSPVLLLQTGRGDELHAALAAARRRGRRAGRDRHRPRPGAPTRSGRSARRRARTRCPRWPAAASWSSPTATTAAWPRRPAACRASSPWSPRPASVAIQPYHRLVSELPVPPAELLDRLRAAGADGRPPAPAGDPAHGGTSTCTPAAGAYAVDAARDAGGGPSWTNLDHALVERRAAARRARAGPGRQADHLRRRRLPGVAGWPARSTPAGPSWPS